MQIKNFSWRLCACIVAAVSFGGGALAETASGPVKRVDPAKFYRGSWLEIARRPMWITDGCVAGTTRYAPTSTPGTVRVIDACREGSPAGPEKVLSGTGTILDPGVNAKLRVQYNPLLTVDYWIVDHANDYSWFIEISPDLDNLFIFTRKYPSRKELASLVARAQALGYDTSKLEFPAHR